MLETMTDFHPNVSSYFKYYPDHLDRHKTMECYIETKESITKNQKEGDVCVLNYEDPVLREFGETLKTHQGGIFFQSAYPETRFLPEKRMRLYTTTARKRP